MSDDNHDQRSIAEKGMEAAKDAVSAASRHVDDVGQHLKEKAAAAKQPETYLQILKDVTKAAPLGMLAIAFIGGMLFPRRRN